MLGVDEELLILIALGFVFTLVSRYFSNSGDVYDEAVGLIFDVLSIISWFAVATLWFAGASTSIIAFLFYGVGAMMFLLTFSDLFNVWRKSVSRGE